MPREVQVRVKLWAPAETLFVRGGPLPGNTSTLVAPLGLNKIDEVLSDTQARYNLQLTGQPAREMNRADIKIVLSGDRALFFYANEDTRGVGPADFQLAERLEVRNLRCQLRSLQHGVPRALLGESDVEARVFCRATTIAMQFSGGQVRLGHALFDWCRLLEIPIDRF
ncbi:hypothetical protein HDU89_001425 [Geranomyces variabilis]|nr:hypothetical protein HDU89_001425 [Geranomyces variabilis]